MYAQVEKPKENKSRAVANSVTNSQNDLKQGLRFIDNRPEMHIQRKISQLVNSRLMSDPRQQQIVTETPIQRELDRKDIDAIIKNVGDDDWLMSIVQELLEIYEENKENINYGKSSQGGHVGIQDYAPFIEIIKKRSFTNEPKIKRQATILHELTHLAEVKSKKGTLALDPKDEIEGFEDMEAQDQFVAKATKVTEWMTPEIDFTKEMSEWLNSLPDLDIDKKQKKYIHDRLIRALTKPHEQPTTTVDLYYYMKAMNLTNIDLYEEIKLAAYTFYQARRGYMPIKD